MWRCSSIVPDAIVRGARGKPTVDKAALNIGKQRHGPTGTIGLFPDAEFMRLGDLNMQHGDGDGD